MALPGEIQLSKSGGREPGGTSRGHILKWLFYHTIIEHQKKRRALKRISDSSFQMSGRREENPRPRFTNRTWALEREKRRRKTTPPLQTPQGWATPNPLCDLRVRQPPPCASPGLGKPAPADRVGENVSY